MSIPNPKGYVKPPQDMPPKGGFFFPKYRMSTLMPKGLTTFQILAVFFGATIFGTYSLIEHSQWSNARNLTQVTQFFGQHSLFKVLYGNAPRMSDIESPGKKAFFGLNPMPQLQGRDPRTEAFVTTVMTDDKLEQVRRWRHATMDADVAPYKVCYGPKHYTTPHVCNSYCIKPAEVIKQRELMFLQWKKDQQKQSL